MTREERLLAAIIYDREAYGSIASVGEQEDFTRQGWAIYQEVSEYYENDETATSVDIPLLCDGIKNKYPRQAQMLCAIIEDLDGVSIPNTLKEYYSLKKEGIKNHLAQLCLENTNDEAVTELMEKFQNVVSVEETGGMDAIVGMGVDELLASVHPDNVIKLAPESLSSRLDGGVLPGHQIAIYAPTEVGKSLVAINMACGLLRDGRKVLYCGNEDPAKAMLLRVYNNLSGMNKHEIIKNPVEAEVRATENGYNNLVFLDMTPGTVAEIRTAVEKYKPDVVFTDQMANMDGNDVNKVEKNEWLASRLRSLAKKYMFVSVILHQASDDAYGKLVLEKNHMYYTNVGVQGQMDVMIGVGMDQNFENQSKRMFTLTKNKITGIHEPFPVVINEQLSSIIEQ